MLFIIECFQRIKTSSPTFFIKLRKAMIVLGLIITCARILIGTGTIQFSPFINQWLQYGFNQSLIVIGTVTGFSFLPIDGNEATDDTRKKIS
jgi:hypothetical protein